MRDLVVLSLCSQFRHLDRRSIRSPRRERRNRFCNCPRAFAGILLIDNASFRNTTVMMLVLRTHPIRRAISGLARPLTTLSFAISPRARSRTFSFIRIRRVRGTGKLSPQERSILHPRQINVKPRSTLQPRNTFLIMHGRMRRKN